MDARHEDFYQALRKRIRKWLDTRQGAESRWAEYVLFAPDLFHLLCKLALDKDVPNAEKSKLAVALAYFVAPIDVLPEIVLGPVGFIDDIALAAYVLNSLVNDINPDIVKKHWAGDEDILHVIRKILKAADDMVGSGLWKKVKNNVPQ